MRVPILMSCLLCAATATAQKSTPLLENDMSTGKSKKIDAPADDFDASLDAALGGATGFSTKDLEAIVEKIRSELKRDRPRATPRIVMFLYPGKVTIEKLRAMREIYSDLEVIMDPCERSVCRDAVGRHIEIVGRAVGSGVVKGNGFTVTLRTLTLRTATQMHDTDVEVYSVPIADCIAAAKKSGGGAAWLDSRQKSDTDYVPIVTKAVQREANARRVSLSTVPAVSRSPAEVEVKLKAKGDRSRYEMQALDAFSAAIAGVRSNPASPSLDKVHLELNMDTQSPSGVRTFRISGSPIGQLLDKKLEGSVVWKSYVEEVKKGKDAGQRMEFSDDDAKGSAPAASGDAPEPDDNEAINTLAQNFTGLANCAREELRRNPKFSGLTLTFKWTPSGGADGVSVKEGPLQKSPVVGCLQKAMTAIHLPRFSGGARTIEYPIRVK